jgi:hypothetical protein
MKINWAGHIARIGDRRVAYRFLWGEMREKDHLEDLRVDGRIIIYIYQREVGWGGIDWILWIRVGTGGRRL